MKRLRIATRSGIGAGRGIEAVRHGLVGLGVARARVLPRSFANAIGIRKAATPGAGQHPDVVVSVSFEREKGFEPCRRKPR